MSSFFHCILQGFKFDQDMNCFLSIFSAFLLIGCTIAPPKEKELQQVAVASPKIKAIDSLEIFLRHYEKFFKTNFNVSECPGAAVVIVKDSSIVYKKGFGVKKIGTQDSVNEHTVFRIASLSKGMTALLAGNLVDRNELDWDQKIKKTLKSFDLRDRAQANRLTVHHLLSHTSGLYKYTNTRLIQRGLPLDQIISSFKYSGVVDKEGLDYEYQNAAFSIVEKIMEVNTGESFGSLLQKRLFEPLGMYDASNSYKAITESSNVALPHRWNHYTKKYYLTPLHKNYYNVIAAGGINASITDMGAYLNALLGNRTDVISDQSLQEIFNPAICTSDKDTYVNLWDGVTDSYYAKGWRVLDYRGRKIVYHGGNVNQYKGQLLVDIKNKIAICVLFNGPNTFNGPVMPTFLTYYDFFTDISRNGVTSE